MSGLARAAIVAEARRWIGTPYRHQASLIHVGCDCLGLVRGVWRALDRAGARGGAALYARLGGGAGVETLPLAAHRHFVARRRANAFRAGDVLLFRFRDHAPAKHLGIATERDAHDARAWRRLRRRGADRLVAPAHRRRLRLSRRHRRGRDLNFEDEMATLAAADRLAPLVAPIGSMLGSVVGAAWRRARRRRAAAARVDALFDRAAPEIDGWRHLDRGRGDSARLWPRAHRRADDLGDALSRADERLASTAARAMRQGRRWLGADGQCHLFLFRQFRDRPLRRADRFRAAHLGRWQRARHDDPADPHLSTATRSSIPIR